MIINLTNNTNSIDPYPWANFHRIVPDQLWKNVTEEAQHYPYFKIEKDRTSNPNRIWLNQQSGILSGIAADFDRLDVKREMSHLLRCDVTSARTRVELCMDNAGSWLEEHTDDSAKLTTMQLYLSDLGSSTRFGKSPTQVSANSAWAFNNKTQPAHSLPILKYNRVSIIINYVNDLWRDDSVLF
jgi:hypothetical protein